MKELSLEQFGRIVVRKIEELKENVTLSNPDTNETYPIGVVNNFMERIISTDEKNIPIRKRFSVSVGWWTDKMYTSIEKYNNCSIKLRELNLTPTGSISQRYDEITKKHICESSYEVYFNGITNSFEKIR